VLIAALTVWEKVRRRSIQRYVLTLSGAAATFAATLVLIRFTAGLKNYWHWTIQFAAERRTPARAEMLGIYTDKMILLWLAFIVAGVLLLWLSRQRNKLLTI